jgi:hypothetical protein
MIAAPHYRSVLDQICFKNKAGSLGGGTEPEPEPIDKKVFQFTPKRGLSVSNEDCSTGL